MKPNHQQSYPSPLGTSETAWQALYAPDPASIGAKGLVFIGDKLLVYKRDFNTLTFPGCWDLPGGGPEANETPYENFRREVLEEFGLMLQSSMIQYVRVYAGVKNPLMRSYFPVAIMSPSIAADIKLGNEGSEFALMSKTEYLNLTDAWPVFQERTREYVEQALGDQ